MRIAVVGCFRNPPVYLKPGDVVTVSVDRIGDLINLGGCRLVSQVVHLTEGEGIELVAGVRMRPLFGDGAMLNLLDFEPGARVPPHSHAHEQLGLVIEGELVIAIEGVEHRLRPGDAYQVPGGVEHAAWTDSGPCRILDVFQPVREDYRERAAAEP